MMDQALEILRNIIPYLHVITAILIIVKAIFVFRNKGFNVPAVIGSFFRIYSQSDVQTSHNEARRQYMRVNNFINYYLYLWIFLSIIMLVVYQCLY